MMWLVRLALRRPLSVAVMALLMMVLGGLSFTLMNVDIFPAINLPVVMVVWSYPGLSAVDMERRMVIISERACSTTVDGIGHMECESMLGIVRRSQRNVKRWSSGEMALRWTAAGMLEAERQFRKIIGYRDLATLVIAIERDHNRRRADIAHTPSKEAAARDILRGRAASASELAGRWHRRPVA